MEDRPTEEDCKKEELKHENLNRAIAALMGLESGIKNLKVRITTPNDAKLSCEVKPAFCIEKPLAATLAESPKLIYETIKKIEDHLNSIESALF
jgi:hypothetical protein